MKIRFDATSFKIFVEFYYLEQCFLIVFPQYCTDESDRSYSSKIRKERKTKEIRS